MTAAKATAKRVELETIWRTITRDVERFTMPDESWDIATVNSKRWTTINEELEDLAAMLVDEVRASEIDSLTTLTEGIWTEIHDRMLAWAETIEADRTARRKLAAA